MFGKSFSLSACAVLALAALPVLPLQAQEAAANNTATGRLQGLSINSGQPIQIEGDKLEVIDGESKAVFTGNVNVTQGPTLMKAGKMTVFYANDGSGSSSTGSANIDRIEVEDKVYIKSDTQVATGDRGTFDMTSQTLVLSGKEVVLSEGKNTLIGCKLTVNMKTSKAEVDGCNRRVIMSITPGSQKN
ncbi:LptA/OstA family protein [Mesorhizobium sp. LHD-90]|uniref:LptA/OstA family protein n=1 Tax=Mesorhizobium sp. LHD-90 TaxID=3071414 RepID=UPI0027DF9937|nr:LptA/OstA family protein [Mesorhizobium sp. LHD-90]MDQ6435782.1 LptA/OstA family protein [Mesorhizobium sp. LHD-90]